MVNENIEEIYSGGGFINLVVEVEDSYRGLCKETIELNEDAINEILRQAKELGLVT